MYIVWWRYLLILAVVAGVIAIVAKLSKKRKGDTQVVPVRTTYSETPRTNSRVDSTSTIFINGGAPASGNNMGTITVDGKTLTVRFTEAPLEITITAGKHHVVVEGGVYGDARIDRTIDFGPYDVWTVDLPGANDADVIRHQMIGYSEYKRALTDSNFNVTKRELK